MRDWNEYKKTMTIPDSLWSAAKANDQGTMSRLLAAGASIDEKDHRGYSPLMLAVYAGHLEATEFLLSLGANPNSVDGAGNSILMGAAFKGHVELARGLLKAGADAQLRNHSGLNAADFATIFARTNVAALLSEAGSTPKKINRAIGFLKILASRFTSKR